jgi:hypothetical protein
MTEFFNIDEIVFKYNLLKNKDVINLLITKILSISKNIKTNEIITNVKLASIILTNMNSKKINIYSKSIFYNKTKYIVGEFNSIEIIVDSSMDYDDTTIYFQNNRKTKLLYILNNDKTIYLNELVVIDSKNFLN